MNNYSEIKNLNEIYVNEILNGILNEKKMEIASGHSDKPKWKINAGTIVSYTKAAMVSVLKSNNNFKVVNKLMDKNSVYVLRSSSKVLIREILKQKGHDIVGISLENDKQDTVWVDKNDLK